MKLELLVVLAAAVLLPNLSECRIVSVCELRNKLQVAIPQIGQQDLALIVCEVKKMSDLNSSLVTVKGNRQPTTTKHPMTTLDATEGTDEPAGANTTGSTPTADYDNTTAAAFTSTASVNASEPVSANSSAPSGISRHKRSPSERKPKSEDDGKQEGDSEEKDTSQEKDSSSEEDHEDSNKVKTWSLGKYGIFQLNDKEFCDSGYRWSQNKCHTSCSAFTDDNIMDDISCFVGQNSWKHILGHVSKSCIYSASTIFSQCN